jgi:hypothetical protein
MRICLVTRLRRNYIVIQLNRYLQGSAAAELSRGSFIAMWPFGQVYKACIEGNPGYQSQVCPPEQLSAHLPSS